MDNIQILYSKIVDNNSLDDIKKVMVDYNQMCELYDNMVEDLKIKERLVQSCKNVILDKLIKYRKEINIIKKQDRLTKDDVKTLIQPTSVNSHQVAPGLRLPLISVPSEDRIPNSYLYTIPGSNQVYVKVLGRVIKGCIGNMDYDKTLKKHIKCKNPKHTPHTKCIYYHPGEIPTWRNSQWLSTNQIYTKGNKLMRHVCGREDLMRQILQATKYEQSIRRGQLMHDLLILMLIFHQDP